MRASYRKLILFTVLAGVVAFILVDPVPDRNARSSVAPATPQRNGQDDEGEPASGVKRATKTLARALPERPALGEPAGELFGSQSWQPPPPKIVAAPATPSAPPMPYRFAGKLMQNGELQVFLSKGDRPVPIKQGEILDGTYRVEAIAEDRITLTYLPLGLKESIPVSTVFSAAGTGAGPQGKPPAATIGTIPTASILAFPSMPSSPQMSQSR